MNARRCSRKRPVPIRAVMHRLRYHPPPATGCAVGCTPCARRPLCSKPGSILCANRRDSNFWDRSLQLFPDVGRSFRGRRGSARAALRVVCLPLQHDERARQLVGHLRAAVLQFLLAPAEFLQFALLFFDLLLLAVELQQLLLRLLHLRIQISGELTSSSLSSSICSIGRILSGMSITEQSPSRLAFSGY